MLSHPNVLLLGLNFMGDILFTTPAVRAIRRKFPEAYITMVVKAGMEDLFRYNPHVNEVLGRERGAKGILKLLPQVRNRQIGTSVLFSYNSVRMAALGRLSGASTRVGFDERGLSRFLTHRVSLNPGVHRVECYLDLARALGAEIDDSRTEMFVGDAERMFAHDLLKSAGITRERPIAALCPGSTVQAKQWFPENYAAVGDALAAEGIDVILLGATEERATSKQVLDAARTSPVDLTGRLRIGELAAVLEQSSLVIGNDTGPLHLAAAVGTPVVGIYGPTDPGITGPRAAKSVVLWQRMECSPCDYSPDCTDRKCMQAITPSKVKQAALQLLAAGRYAR